ncbi:MAG: O-antigen ligase family protein [Lachnospiraceae bacterium]|nr:O-antigen ligase family protein [Lachnospiraceae bacterium]
MDKNWKENFRESAAKISDRQISITASVAMSLFIIATALMSVFAMIKRSIDFTMDIFPAIIKYMAFPLTSIIVVAVYFLVIAKTKAEGRSFLKIIKSNPLFVVFAAMVIFIICSQIYNGMDYALSGFCSASIAETFPMEIGYFIFVLFGATQVKMENHKRLLMRLHIIVSLLVFVAAFVLWNTQVESEFFYDWTPRYSSIYSNINYYGYYLALTVPLAAAAFLYEAGIVWKVIAAIAFVSNTVALSLDNTMGAWVGGFFAMIFIAVAHFIIERKFNVQVLILLVVFCICMYVPGRIMGTFGSNLSQLASDVSNIAAGNEAAEHAGSGRMRIWKASLDIANENSMLGIGFEGVKYWEYVGAPYNIRPHNEFIQYAMFHGYPTALLYFIGCLGIFIRALKKKKIMDGATLCCLCGAFGYLVSSFFGLTVFSTAAFLFIFMGMGYVSEPVKKA